MCERTRNVLPTLRKEIFHRPGMARGGFATPASEPAAPGEIRMACLKCGMDVEKTIYRAPRRNASAPPRRRTQRRALEASRPLKIGHPGPPEHARECRPSARRSACGERAFGRQGGTT